jgi:hypothetical protein
MSRSSAVRATLAVAASALVVAACTGGDGGTELVVDGVDGDPSEVVSAAGERTAVTSGRLRDSYRMDFSQAGAPFAATGADGAPAPSGSMSTEFTGSFSGGDYDGEVTLRMEGPEETDRFERSVRVVIVDGAVYTDVPDVGMLLGDEEARQDSPIPSIEAAAAGRTWFEDAPLEAGDQDDSFEVFALDSPNGALEILGELDQVRELDPVQVDGEELQRFTGRAAQKAILGADPGLTEGEPDTGTGDEERSRLDRIGEYGAAHQWFDVEIAIDADGYVRRLDLRAQDSVEEQFRDCLALVGFGGFSYTVEYEALGEPVDVVAPDPADTMGYDERQAITDDWYATWEPSAIDEPFEEEPMSAEERLGYEEELRAGAATIGIDPGTISAMTDDELFAALEQLWMTQPVEQPSMDELAGLAEGFASSYLENCPE